MKKIGVGVFSTGTLIVLYAFAVKSPQLFQTPMQVKNEVNHAPVVKLLAPKNNSAFSPTAVVPYAITVTDAEDGSSEYQEIESNEVLLEVRYVADATKAAALANQKEEPAALTLLKTSNCFNCHAFNSKVIGPSFTDISKRYSPIASNVTQVAKRIHDGSTGVWGTVSMPSHPELTNEQCQSLAQWLLKNGSNQDLNYYRGLEGSVRLKAPTSASKGVFVLTATYTDHGTNAEPEKRLQGRDAVVVKMKPE